MDLRLMAERTASLYGLPPELVKAQIKRESSWNPGARGASGEIGLMQIILRTLPAGAKLPGITEGALWDPETNIKQGCKYMRWIIDYLKFKAPWLSSRAIYRLALISYNGGYKYVTQAISLAGPEAGLTSILENLKSTRIIYSWVIVYAKGVMGDIQPRDLVKKKSLMAGGPALALSVVVALVLLFFKKKK